MRMMNRSARTIAFATKVKPSTARRINTLAISQRKRIVELLEDMVDEDGSAFVTAKFMIEGRLVYVRCALAAVQLASSL
jgi:hypothetical protein